MRRRALERAQLELRTPRPACSVAGAVTTQLSEATTSRGACADERAGAAADRTRSRGHGRARREADGASAALCRVALRRACPPPLSCRAAARRGRRCVVAPLRAEKLPPSSHGALQPLLAWLPRAAAPCQAPGAALPLISAAVACPGLRCGADGADDGPCRPPTRAGNATSPPQPSQG